MERDSVFHYDLKKRTMIIALIACARIFRLNQSPLFHWKGHAIYTGSVY